jgi:hypothetical protein
MAKFILFILLFVSIVTNAQKKSKQSQQKITEVPTARIIFSYDIEGNQIERKFCYGCTSKIVNPIPKEIIALKEEDLQKFSTDDVISYYPNPVNEELYLKWELINDNTVFSINVYGLNGQLLKSYSGLTKTNSKNITFQNYPTGTYAVVLFYSNGEQKSIKIIKQ